MAKKKKDSYSIEVGYQAVLEVIVLAEDETTARELGMAKINKALGEFNNKSGVGISDSNYSPNGDGIRNLTKSWNKVQN